MVIVIRRDTMEGQEGTGPKEMEVFNLLVMHSGLLLCTWVSCLLNADWPIPSKVKEESRYPDQERFDHYAGRINKTG